MREKACRAFLTLGSRCQWMTGRTDVISFTKLNRPCSKEFSLYRRFKILLEGGEERREHGGNGYRLRNPVKRASREKKVTPILTCVIW